MKRFLTHTYLTFTLLLSSLTLIYGQSPNLKDRDDDNDGIPDVIEICGVGATDFSCAGGFDPDADFDQDDTPNFADPDYCTLNSAGVCIGMDADEDGIPNHHDVDSDNDGIPDIIEAGGVDTDGNGLVDCFLGTVLIDANRNGLCDIYDVLVGGTAIALPDTDGDGVLDYLDLDSDNDGIPDIIESGGVDEDGDGRLATISDFDTDGFYDTYDNFNDLVPGINEGDELALTGPDAGNGTPLNLGTTPDADNNNIPNYLDLDADGDGVPDVVEGGGVDVNGDGIADNYADSDEDGFHDIYDFGLPINGNPMLNTGPDTGSGHPATYPLGDTDEDGVPNFLDLDSDNDAIPDLIEAGGVDLTGDGIVDNPFDSDNDGYADIYDGNAGGNALINTGLDITLDGRPNLYPEGDWDYDRILNIIDLDSDYDGIPDLKEVFVIDSTGSGQISGFTDFDKNGYHDLYDPSIGGTPVGTTGQDTNGDGYPDFLSSLDTDSDFHYDFLDIDSDNDGIVDLVEWQATIGFMLPLSLDADKDGIDDMFDITYSLIPPRLNDMDGDNTPDTRDTDSDGDGAADYIEGWDYDMNGLNGAEPNPGVFPVGTYPSGLDSDNDGLMDIYDSINYVVTPDPIFNSTNNYTRPVFRPYNSFGTAGTPGGPDMDWREDDVDPFPVELYSFNAELDGEDATLNWITLSELNNDYFEIERSIDGVLFEKIGQMQGGGTLETESQYEYTDLQVLRFNVPTLYYRLKQVDFDGTFEYTQIIELKLDLINKIYAGVYPNPATDKVQISFATDSQALEGPFGEMTIHSNNGQMVYKKTFMRRAESFSLDLTDFPKGMYIVNMYAEEGVKSLKLIVY